jgi:hypothetical protein
MKKRFIFKNENGIAVFLIVILVMAAGMLIFTSLAFGVLSEVRIGRSALFSAQAYYASEAGMEDIMLRLRPDRQIPSIQPYSFAVGSSSVTVTLGQPVGGTRQITSEGEFENRYRKLSAVATLGVAEISFFYGAQVGEGGLSLGENSIINGNLFSNGDVNGAGAAKSEITGTVKVSGSHTLSDIKISEDAYAQNLLDCEVVNTAHYVSSIINCPAGSTQVIASPPDPVALPINDEQINAWKNEAASGGTLPGYTLGNNQSATLGLKKIEGNMTLGNSSILTLTGTVWVTGTINLGNTVIIKLDLASYGSLSGVLVADGFVELINNVELSGSGEPGSYLMLLVTTSGSAIEVNNSAAGSVLYAPNGTIIVGNNMSVREATAYRLQIDNNAEIVYETGLADSSFTSGPSAGWRVLSWTEVE